MRTATLEFGSGRTLRRLEATIDAAGFSTGNNQRDADVIGPKFLDTERFSDIVFRGDRLVDDGTEPRIEGMLTVRGQSLAHALTVDLRASAAEDGGRLRCRATSTVDRTAYGVDAMRHIVAHTLALTLDVVFLRVG